MSDQLLMDFPAEEYQLRRERLYDLLDKEGLDGLLISEYSNFRYFAGFDMPFAAWSGYIKTRPFICLIPAKGRAPVLLVHTSFEDSTRFSSWITDIRSWSSIPFSVDVLKDLLKAAGLDKKSKIGLELGEEQRLGFPVNIYDRLRDELPQNKFVDASSLLWDLRIKKTERELDCIRNACVIMAGMYQKLFQTIKAGVSEQEIRFTMRKLMSEERDVENPNFLLISVFPGGVVGRAPGPRKLNQGGLLWMDGGVVYKGYRSDFSRIAIAGKPTGEQMESYKKVRGVTASLVEAVKPGLNVEDLTRKCDLEMEKAGIPPKKAGRLGHGIGLDTAEPPSVMIGDGTILEPGMVITIEPGFLKDCGYFVLEEIVAVTDTGYKLLTVPSPLEPFVCG